MSMAHEGIIVLLAGADPETDRFAKAAGEDRTTIVPVSDPSSAGRAAAGLVADGAQRIELCGGLGPQTAGKVVRAVGDRVPVGAVAFGVDSVDGAAEFRAGVERNTPMVAGFIFRQDGLDPVADRAVVEFGGLRTVFVPVSRESDAAKVAVELVDQEGSDLIELYRGIGSVAAGEVIDAVGGRVPVGSVRYGREQFSITG